MLPVASVDASTVSIREFTCPTDAASTAGTSRRPTWRTPSWRVPTRGFVNRCSRAMNGPWKQSCTAPAASTPQASAKAMSAPAKAASSIAETSEAFSNTGVEGWNRKAVVHVENAPGKRRQGNETKVWKGDANQVGSEPEPMGVVPETRRERR